MNPPDTVTTIEDIKKQLREIIELSDKATPGEWTSKRRFQNSFEISEPHIWLGESSSLPMGQQQHNASFVATSRNITPKVAKALLTVITSLEALAASEVSADSHEACNHPDDAKEALETICREWEVQA